MVYAVAYVTTLLLFAAIDIAWLTVMAAKLYRQTLGDILLQDVRIAPAIAFYIIYPMGLVIFAVMPALKLAAPSTALIYGALFGFFAYATYELTNFATLRNWTLEITVIDIIYGAAVSGAVAALVTLIAPRVAMLLGASISG
jgi:uncharacterized membrane protein